MCEKMIVIDHQHRYVVTIMASKLDFLVTKDEMLVALATTIFDAILSPGMTFEILCLC